MADLEAILAEDSDDDTGMHPTLEDILAESDDEPTTKIGAENFEEISDSDDDTPLPASKPPPTSSQDELLQSILAEDDDDGLGEDAPDVDLILNNLEETPKATNTSKTATTSEEVEEGEKLGGLAKAEQAERNLASFGNYNIVAPLRSRRRVGKDAASIHGILRRVRLNMISAQLANDTMRRDAGLPTCIAIHSKFIAVGTSHGLILIFDHFQDLKLFLIHPSGGVELGQVISAEFSTSGDWVVAGHQRGGIVIWDIVNAQPAPVKTILDAHEGPVVHAFFLDNRTIISADTKGVVLLISLSKVMFAYLVSKTRLLDDANAIGTILSMAPLFPSPSSPHLSASLQLVAMCSPDLAFVVALKPEVNVCFKLKRADSVRRGAVPYLSWRRAMLGEKDSAERGKVMDPILAIAWGKTIQLLQVVLTSPKNAHEVPHLEFMSIGSYHSESEITGMQWLGEQVIVFMNVNNQVCLFDPFTMEELELSEITSNSIVYHTCYHVDGRDELSFNHSFRASDNTLYLLGLDQVNSASVLSWSGRIQLLVEANEWLQALALALDFYEGRAKAVVGLPRDMKQLRAITGRRVADLLSEYFELAMSKGPSAHVQQESYYQTLCGVCIDYCITVDRTDLLFTEIFSKFCGAGQGGIFLELLEPYILNDKLSHLNPGVMQSFVDHYKNKRLLRRVEQCILHMDISSLDFHQVVTLCRKYHLYSALIYVYNKGLDDFLTPMEDLMEVLAAGVETTLPPEVGDEAAGSSVHVGYKLLLYLSYCLSGRAFPRGTLPPARMRSLRSEILSYLFTQNTELSSRKFPRLSQLLSMDTGEFLNVLAVVFDDTKSAVTVDEKASSLTCQAMMDALVSVVVDVKQQGWSKHVQSNWFFDSKSEGALFSFMAKYIANGTVKVDRYLINRVMSYLVLGPPAPTPSDSPLRQTLMQDLLTSGACGDDCIKIDDLLPIVENAKFYRVAVALYKKQNNFTKVVECYMRDTQNKNQVFDFVSNIMSDPSLPEEVSESVKKATLSHLRTLVQLNNNATARLMTAYFAKENITILKQLEQYPEVQFEYLKGILSTEKRRDVMDDGETKARSSVLTLEMQELYIKLLCRYDPSKVLGFLSSHDDYRIDYCLSLCRKYEITPATSFLLERAGDVAGALSLTLETVEEKLANLKTVFEATPPNDDIDLVDSLTEQEAAATLLVEEALSVAVQLCRRNSQKLEDSESEVLWFLLLDKFVIPQRELKVEQNRYKDPPPPIVKMQHALASFISTVLYNMMGFISFPAILSKIVKDHGTDEFGEFRHTIVGMLDTYSYEQNILRTAKHLLSDDTFRSMKVLYKHRMHAYVPPTTKGCAMCGTALYGPGVLRDNEVEESTACTVFSCRHAYHGQCLGQTKQCIICNRDKSDVEEPKKEPRAQAQTKKETRKYLSRLDKVEKTAVGRREPSRFEVFLELGKGTELYEKVQPLLHLAPKQPQTEINVAARIPGSMEEEPRYWNEIGDDELWENINY